MSGALLYMISSDQQLEPPCLEFAHYLNWNAKMLKSIVLSPLLVLSLAGQAQSGASVSSDLAADRKRSVAATKLLLDEVRPAVGKALDGECFQYLVVPLAGAARLNINELAAPSDQHDHAAPVEVEKSHLEWDSGGPVGPVTAH